MANLDNALQQLREERKQAQLRVEKLYQAISVIESLRRFRSIQQGNPTDPNCVGGFTAQNGAGAASEMGTGEESSIETQATISAAGRRRIAAAQRARWAKVRAKQRKTA